MLRLHTINSRPLCYEQKMDFKLQHCWRVKQPSIIFSYAQEHNYRHSKVMWICICAYHEGIKVYRYSSTLQWDTWSEYMLAALFYGEEYLLPIKQGAGWTQEPAWTFWRIHILLLFSEIKQCLGCPVHYLTTIPSMVPLLLNQSHILLNTAPTTLQIQFKLGFVLILSTECVT